ncbi:MAG: alpha/beta hydrolase [Candidatus Sungbacteria bacterium]|uniref:Alpha/beta hydrolase n=1 Tax=Candidatus Sungiibacteriota bacterium TaxID=2750080 RepID=A0A9D6LTG0_9BACT|nr:alpha/beta hydrolase [Candidatus Sungbacteria bacterium]
MNERVELKTEDGITIVGDYYEGGGEKAALLLHMMPATRASWVTFANTLAVGGFSSLAIDLRGHGESIAGPAGALDYLEFEEARHQASLLDIAAAADFLKKEKKMKEISLAGASIGANLSFVFGTGEPGIRSVLLLSCGLDYKGLDLAAALRAKKYSPRVFFVASEDDEYSAASTKELFGKYEGEKKLEIFKDAGHGTTIFERKPEFIQIAADWMTR